MLTATNYKYRDFTSSKVACFISVDPLQFKYAYYTPYQYAGNKPISFIDLDGAEEYLTDNLKNRFLQQYYFNNPPVPNEDGFYKLPFVTGPVSSSYLKEIGATHMYMGDSEYSNQFTESKLDELKRNSEDFNINRDGPYKCAAHYYEVLDILYPNKNYTKYPKYGAKDVTRNFLLPSGLASKTWSVVPSYKKITNSWGQDELTKYNSNLESDPYVSTISGLSLYVIGPGGQFHTGFLIVNARDPELKLTYFDNHGVYENVQEVNYNNEGSLLDDELKPRAQKGYRMYKNPNTIVTALKQERKQYIQLNFNE